MQMARLIFIKEKFTMISHKDCSLCFSMVLLVLISCQEPPGFGVNMAFFPQTCESMAVRGVFTDELACFVFIRGGETEHDSMIESVASDWFYGKHPGFKTSPGGSALFPLYYTLNLCKGISVFLENNDVSEHFIVRQSEDSMCWLTEDKQIINVSVPGISIVSFLEFHPFVPARFELCSEDLSKEEMAGRTFTIELEIDNGTTMTADWVYEPFIQ